MCWQAATFASYTGTAPIEAFSGDVVRHRLSRAGDRQLNCALHSMATTQIGRDTPGRALLPNGNAPPQRVTGKRCAAGRGGSRTSPIGSFSATRRQSWRQAREDTRGRLYRPARQADTPHTGPVTSLTVCRTWVWRAFGDPAAANFSPSKSGPPLKHEVLWETGAGLATSIDPLVCGSHTELAGGWAVILR
ncbi:IS110 family transposase [Rhodococcus opacus]|uniref:IS110 family transposase n=1 Tax=Rhodococcus opacus TaxID=37919 RepID=UPI001FF31A21|nr:IS110 family transposase [Rhodococcus opacus]UOT03708.1 IS110 family transposase [Rhodococcus opacus]